MPRRTFDLIVTVGGVLLLFVLIAAGALWNCGATSTRDP